jgi:hypothetical protein
VLLQPFDKTLSYGAGGAQNACFDLGHQRSPELEWPFSRSVYIFSPGIADYFIKEKANLKKREGERIHIKQRLSDKEKGHHAVRIMPLFTKLLGGNFSRSAACFLKCDLLSRRKCQQRSGFWTSIDILLFNSAFVMVLTVLKTALLAGIWPQCPLHFAPPVSFMVD